MEWTFHYWAPKGYILFKKPINHHSRYIYFAAITSWYSNVLPDEIYDFLPPLKNYQTYAQKTQSTGTVLTRGATGDIFLRNLSIFRRRKKRKTEKCDAILDWIAIYGNPVIRKSTAQKGVTPQQVQWYCCWHHFNDPYKSISRFLLSLRRVMSAEFVLLLVSDGKVRMTKKLQSFGIT